MTKINLNYNNAYEWTSIGKNYFIGYIYYNNKFLYGKDALELIKNNSDIEKKLKEFEGHFSFVLDRDKDIIIASDIVRTYPVFYKIEDEIEITDNIMSYHNKSINKKYALEIESSCFVTGYNTVFDNIYQLQGHECVYINKKTKEIKRKKYWECPYNINKSDDNKIIKELDQTYNLAAKKMIEYLDGRKAVIPLSGGQDSRLLAYYLHKNGYTNVLAYTYGSLDNSEVNVSKKVAEFFNFEWTFVEYKNESMQSKFNDEKIYKEMADYCGRGFSLPIVQEWEAISTLIKEKKIDPNKSVIISGHEGNVLAGSCIYEYLYDKKSISWKELKEFMYKMLFQYSTVDFEKADISDKMNELCNMYGDNKIIPRDEAIHIWEKFNFEERDVKYITNALRMYDYHGIEWYVMYWDKNVIEKWVSISLDKRYNKDIQTKFTNKIYGDLMKKAPIYKEKSGKKIKPPFYLIKLSKKVYDRYKHGFLNFYGYLYFRTYLRFLIKTRKVDYNKMFAMFYVEYLKKNAAMELKQGKNK